MVGGEEGPPHLHRIGSRRAAAGRSLRLHPPAAAAARSSDASTSLSPSSPLHPPALGAGAWGACREREGPKLDAARPVDLSPECVGLLERLMLAQAQECVYRRAVLDGKSPALLARRVDC